MPSGGRILTDTFYDAAGRAVEDYGAYYDHSGAPGTDLVTPLSPDHVPNQTQTVYDGAGRPIASIFEPKTVDRWRTSTTYGGDHTDVAPPQGATATSTWLDARGHTRKTALYKGTSPTANGQLAQWDYDQANQRTP